MRARPAGEASLDVAGDLIVGENGTGTLSILDGGSVSAGNVYIGGTGTGVAVARAAAALASSPSAGAMIIDGQTASLTANGVILVVVEEETDGASLTIANGAQVTTEEGLTIDGSRDTPAFAAVNAGATLNGTGRLIVGDRGIAELRVNDGGTLTFSGKVIVGFHPTGIGTVLIDSDATLDTSGELIIGDAGEGHLGIGNSGPTTATHVGDVTVGARVLGNGRFGTGEVLVGTGSTWSIDGDLAVGDKGSGHFEALANASVTVSGDLNVGVAADRIGDVVLRGAGSGSSSESLHVGGAAAIAVGGDVEFLAESGALITFDGPLKLAAANGSSATMILKDGSTLVARQDVVVGSGGLATVAVQGGSLFDASAASVAVDTQGTGHSDLVIEGSGSRLIADSMTIGLQGGGGRFPRLNPDDVALRVDDGGLVQIAQTLALWNDAISVGAGGGMEIGGIGVAPAGVLRIDSAGVLTGAGEVLGNIVNNGIIEATGRLRLADHVLGGVAVADSTVDVYLDGDLVGSAEADGNGDWSFTTPGLSDAIHVLTTKPAGSDLPTNKVVIGASGADTLTGDAFLPDYLVGRGGGDTYEVNSSATQVVEQRGGGVDTVLASVDFALPDQVENLTLLDSGGSTNAVGNGLDNALVGNASGNILSGRSGDDSLDGGGGDDKLLGGSGADELHGEAGHDLVKGNGGEDVLVGGAGRDILVDGPGADTFVFAFAADSSPGAVDRDRIRDFTPGLDKIDLTGIDAIMGSSDDDAFNFIGADTFSRTAGELRMFYNGADNTVIAGDVDGNGRADFQLVLIGHHALQASDFLL